MKDTTLCLLVKEDHLLLGFKKSGFGAGKYNGFGGKVNPHETIEDAALRELHEETGISTLPENLDQRAELQFYFSHHSEWDQRMYVFLVRNWSGEPRETEEMSPAWFSFAAIPYPKMWVADQYWLPAVLQGKRIRGFFVFGEEGSSVLNYRLDENP